MPYIKPWEREDLDPAVLPSTAGGLNYAITALCKEYMDARGGVCYSNINEVIGVLECAKQELYRRVAAPYEDIKIKENGDVY
tara:strand:- start:201 stop:446 length:246 start_codon:yes stop_codon:yes gene_type:complete